ncbi:hypothetical protein [Pedobacter sp. UBA4863]|uniref:hypothetical protein n=1 Tax=Pedobacter sp. UBA4863 TaxID=1947060 RepID=UPI0025D19BC1|nr:hypothetical protein [Pedobacter sp. UBA4863]
MRVKLYRSVISIFIFLNLMSCIDNRESKIKDLLNSSLESFDKSKFDLVSVVVIDTISYAKLYLINSFNKYNPNEDQQLYLEPETTIVADTVISDTVVTDDIQTTLDWNYESYTSALHKHIRYDYNNSNYTKGEQETPNIFLNQIVKMPIKQFRHKILNDKNFRSDFGNEIKNYKHFNGVFSADSLNKFLNIEIEKDREFFCYITSVKFRNDGKLKSIYILFDEQDNIIGYKE